MSDKPRVRDWMTAEVATLHVNDNLLLADDLLRLGRIRHLPVLDDDGRLAGIVSQRDLFRGALARALGYGEFAQTRLIKSMLVKEIMTPDPCRIPPDATIAEAAKIMIDRKIGCLCVVDDGALVGILTEADFVSAQLA